jgi:hypothetical protein
MRRSFYFTLKKLLVSSTARMLFLCLAVVAMPIYLAVSTIPETICETWKAYGAILFVVATLRFAALPPHQFHSHSKSRGIF